MIVGSSAIFAPVKMVGRVDKLPSKEEQERSVVQFARAKRDFVCTIGSMICIGPHLTPFETKERFGPEVEFTGYALEFATSDKLFRVPIYRKVHSWDPESTSIDDLVFPEEFQYWNLHVWEHQIARTATGLFLPFGSLLCAFYTQFPAGRTVTDLLTEIRDAIRLHERHSRRHFVKPELISPELREYGFDILNVYSFGRTVSVGIGWLFPQDRNNPEPSPCIEVGTLDFKPTHDGRLKGSKWPISQRYRIADLLWETARSMSRASAISLLSEEGKCFVLDSYEWSPLAKLSAKEARNARAKFIAENPALTEHPKLLAESLKAAGLYSANTSVSQICKHLPSILSQAGKQQGN